MFGRTELAAYLPRVSITDLFDHVLRYPIVHCHQRLSDLPIGHLQLGQHYGTVLSLPAVDDTDLRWRGERVWGIERVGERVWEIERVSERVREIERAGERARETERVPHADGHGLAESGDDSVG